VSGGQMSGHRDGSTGQGYEEAVSVVEEEAGVRRWRVFDRRQSNATLAVLRWCGGCDNKTFV